MVTFFKKILIYLLFIIIGITLYYVSNNCLKDYIKSCKNSCNVLVPYKNIETFNIGIPYDPLDPYDPLGPLDQIDPDDRKWTTDLDALSYISYLYIHNPFTLTTTSSIDNYSQEYRTSDGLATLESPIVIYAVRSTNGLYVTESGVKRIRSIWRTTQEIATITDERYGYNYGRLPSGQLNDTFTILSNTNNAPFGLIIPPMIEYTSGDIYTFGWLPLDGHFIATCFENSNDMGNGPWDTSGGGNLDNESNGDQKSPFNFLTNSGTVVNRGPNYGVIGIAGRKQSVIGNNMKNIFWVAGSIKVERESMSIYANEISTYQDEFSSRIINTYNQLSIEELKSKARSILRILISNEIDNIGGLTEWQIDDITDITTLRRAIRDYEEGEMKINLNERFQSDNRTVSVYYKTRLVDANDQSDMEEYREYEVSGFPTTPRTNVDTILASELGLNYLSAVLTHDIDAFNSGENISYLYRTATHPDKWFTIHPFKKQYSTYTFSVENQRLPDGRPNMITINTDIPIQLMRLKLYIPKLDPFIPKEYPLTTCGDMYNAHHPIRPDIFKLMKASRVLLDPNRCYAYLMRNKYLPLAQDFRIIRGYNPINPTPFAYTTEFNENNTIPNPGPSRLLWKPKRNFPITRDWLKNRGTESEQSFYLNTTDNTSGYTVEELANAMIETNKKILYTFGTSLINYLHHHPGRINNPIIHVVVPPVSAFGIDTSERAIPYNVKLIRIRYQVEIDPSLSDEEAVNEAIRQLAITFDITDISITLNDKIDTIYDFLDLSVQYSDSEYSVERDYFRDNPFYVAATAMYGFTSFFRDATNQIEIKHGLGSYLAIDQWTQMASLTETLEINAQFHRMRVRLEIQKCLNKINEIHGVEVVYSHLANMNDRDDDYIAVIENLSNPFDTLAQEEIDANPPANAVPPPDPHDSPSVVMRTYRTLHNTYKQNILTYMVDGTSSQQLIPDIRHPIHQRNNQKYGHIGYIINADEYNTGFNYNSDAAAARSERNPFGGGPEEEELILQRLNDNAPNNLTLSVGTKVYVYGSHLQTNNIWVYVVNDPINRASIGRIVLVDINNIGYKSIRNSETTRFKPYENQGQDHDFLLLEQCTDVNKCAAWLVGCNPFNVALQYPIEGGGQIDTLRWERKIQPRALGLLTTLSIVSKHTDNNILYVRVGGPGTGTGGTGTGGTGTGGTGTGGTEGTGEAGETTQMRVSQDSCGVKIRFQP